MAVQCEIIPLFAHQDAGPISAVGSASWLAFWSLQV